MRNRGSILAGATGHSRQSSACMSIHCLFHLSSHVNAGSCALPERLFSLCPGGTGWAYLAEAALLNPAAFLQGQWHVLWRGPSCMDHTAQYPPRGALQAATSRAQAWHRWTLPLCCCQQSPDQAQASLLSILVSAAREASVRMTAKASWPSDWKTVWHPQMRRTHTWPGCSSVVLVSGEFGFAALQARQQNRAASGW